MSACRALRQAGCLCSGRSLLGRPCLHRGPPGRLRRLHHLTHVPLEFGLTRELLHLPGRNLLLGPEAPCPEVHGARERPGAAVARDGAALEPDAALELGYPNHSRGLDRRAHFSFCPTGSARSCARCFRSIISLVSDDVPPIRSATVVTSRGICLALYTMPVSCQDPLRRSRHLRANKPADGPDRFWVAKGWGTYRRTPCWAMRACGALWPVVCPICLWVNMLELADKLLRGRSRVVSRPDLLSGEPVFEGTRISVRFVGERARKGESATALLEEPCAWRRGPRVRPDVRCARPSAGAPQEGGHVRPW